MKTFKIAGIELKNRYVQAPLAGFTDYSMRRIAAEKGASLVYSEMESAEALNFNSEATLEDLKTTFTDRKYEPETKLALQIFGGKKDSVLHSIPLFEKNASYDFLDFNCGCPVPKVIKQHAGSYWMMRQDELIDLLKDMVKISNKPVILKIRIGFNKVIEMVPLCKRIEEAGVEAIAIHGRTKTQGFQGQVNYDIIKDVKKNVSIPIIVNGAIDETNCEQILEETGTDAAMIGQRAIGYPKVFEDLIRTENGEKLRPTTLDSQIDDLKKHLEYIFAAKDEKSASDIMRSISVRYLKGLDDTRQYRMQLVHCQSLDAYLSILKSMQSEQN